jgi:4a-hydroxytetrahydrobiopterin dehydratase
MSNFTIPSSEELESALTPLPNWSVLDGKLLATFTFVDFRTAFTFMTLVAEQAETLGHHPEWANSYNTVTCMLFTHEADDQITSLDLKLAEAINGAALALREE